MAQENKSEMTDFEKFIHDRGCEFKTEEALQAAYDRAWKCKHGILISLEEFITEANRGFKHTAVLLKAVYENLVELVENKKLTASDVYRYAYFGWCLKDAAAIVAYERERNNWEVNNCDTAITEEAAKIEVNREWGFEASRIKIIGTPYYDATDWQFIRFDCAHMTWLWKNGSIYQVYE